jgi:hypothetical protein
MLKCSVLFVTPLDQDHRAKDCTFSFTEKHRCFDHSDERAIGKNGVAGNRTQNLLHSVMLRRAVLRRCHTTRPQPHLMLGFRPGVLIISSAESLSMSNSRLLPANTGLCFLESLPDSSLEKSGTGKQFSRDVLV